MAELRSTTAIGGNIVWHGGNLRFDPQGDTILYQGYKIYTEHDTPLPGELGNGGTTSAFTKTEADARFAPIARGGYVQKTGDTMTGKLTNTANEIEIRGRSPRLLLQDNDGTKRWYLINDGGNFSVRENDTATTRFRIDATAANFMIENIDINSKTAFRGFDSWLRINDQLAFTTGVYFGSSLIRTDGTLQVGDSTASGFVVNTTAIKYKNNNVFHDGYHPNADKWTTARTLTTTLTGDVTGSASMSIDGSANATVTVTATVANDSHTHDGRYYTETESDARFANVTGDTFTGNVAISKAAGRLSFNETDYANNNSGINWITSANQNLELIHEITDGDLNTSGGNGQALQIRSNGGTFAQAGLEVEGEIFAKSNQRVFHDAYHPNADRWTTARTITIGNTARSVNGSSNVSWTVAEIGAAPRGYGLGEYGRSLPSSILGNTALRRESGFWQGSSITGLPTYGHTWKYLWTQAHSNAAGYWGYIGVDFDCTAAFFGGQSAGVDKAAIRLFADNYHPNADKWTTARILTLSGDLSGSVSINGGSNVTLTATVANDSHNHTSLDGITKLRFGPGVPATDDAAIEWLGESNAGYLRFSTADDNGTEYMQFGDYDNTAQGGTFTQWLKMYRGQAQFTGNVSASTFTGALSGNASTASKWATARSLSLSGDASGSVSWDGSANATLSVTVANDSHTHDGRYFTESESNSRFAYKAGSSGQDFNARQLNAHGFGNDYNSGGVELWGNGSSIYPNIGFHQPGAYAGSLQLRGGGDFRFYAQGGSSYGVVRAAKFYGYLSGNASTASWADKVDVNTSTSTSFHGLLWHSGDTIYASGNQGLQVRPSDGFTKIKHGYLGNERLYHDTTGRIIASLTGGRRAGMYGTYESNKIAHIWSMGASYMIDDNGATFGNLFGLAYKHTNNSTGGTMAGGHQMVWCDNGSPKSAMGDNIWTSGNVTAYSDIRVKTNIERIQNPLEKVSKLGGYTYDRLDIETDRQTGVIAQEVLEVLPEAVTGGPTEADPDGHYSVAYGNLTGLLIEATKELNKKVEALQNEVQELKRPWWKKLLRL